VDAISWTPIFTRFAYRVGSDALIENDGVVNVALRTVDTDASTERVLISGDSLPFKTDGPRAQGFAPVIRICFAKAAGGTGTLKVVEK
jgi:hypothetical protein